MISLKNYIINQNVAWDGHLHLFNDSQVILDLYNSQFKKCIGFADIEFDHIEDYDGKMVGMYNSYIENYYNDNQILLATAPTAKEAIEVYKEFPNIIKGFGELKLYDNYQGKEVPYKKIITAREVCAFSSKNNNLPVYIHYSLTNDSEVRQFNNLLKSYPTVPIVLCHCGMEENNKDFAYQHCVDLMKKYYNFWVDISYDAADYFVLNPMKLYNLDMGRIILGSDCTLKTFGQGHEDPKLECDENCNKVTTLSKYINSDFNIKKIF